MPLPRLTPSALLKLAKAQLMSVFGAPTEHADTDLIECTFQDQKTYLCKSAYDQNEISTEFFGPIPLKNILSKIKTIAETAAPDTQFVIPLTEIQAKRAHWTFLVVRGNEVYFYDPKRKFPWPKTYDLTPLKNILNENGYTLKHESYLKLQSWYNTNECGYHVAHAMKHAVTCQDLTTLTVPPKSVKEIAVVVQSAAEIAAQADLQRLLQQSSFWKTKTLLSLYRPAGIRAMQDKSFSEIKEIARKKMTDRHSFFSCFNTRNLETTDKLYISIANAESAEDLMKYQVVKAMYKTALGNSS